MCDMKTVKKKEKKKGIKMVREERKNCAKTKSTMESNKDFRRQLKLD